MPSRRRALSLCLTLTLTLSSLSHSLFSLSLSLSLCLCLSYHPRFRLTRSTIRHDYPALWAHTRRVFALPGVEETVDIEGIKSTYYHSVPLASKAGLTIAATPHDFDLHEPLQQQPQLRASL